MKKVNLKCIFELTKIFGEKNIDISKCPIDHDNNFFTYQ